MANLWQIFWTYLRVTLLSPSGPACVGLLYDAVVGRFLNEDQFTKIVATASGLPGSDSLQLGLAFGYEVAGPLGAIVGLIASIIPPVTFMIGIWALAGLGSEYLSKFVNGLKPVVAVLIIGTALKLAPSSNRGWILAGLAAIGTLLKMPPVLLLICGGLIGLLLG